MFSLLNSFPLVKRLYYFLDTREAKKKIGRCSTHKGLWHKYKNITQYICVKLSAFFFSRKGTHFHIRIRFVNKVGRFHKPPPKCHSFFFLFHDAIIFPFLYQNQKGLPSRFPFCLSQFETMGWPPLSLLAILFYL